MTAKVKAFLICAVLKIHACKFYRISGVVLRFTCKSLFKHSDWLFLAARWRALKPGISQKIKFYEQFMKHVDLTGLAYEIDNKSPYQHHRRHWGLLLERWWPPDSPVGLGMHRGEVCQKKKGQHIQSRWEMRIDACFKWFRPNWFYAV